HHKTTSILRDLGNLYVDVGRAADACPLFEEAWKLERARSGPTNFQTLRMQNRLANALYSANRATEAVPVAAEALRGSLAILAPEHNTTLYALEMLTVSAVAAGRIREALPLLEDFLQRAETSPATTNRLVYDATEICARTWLDQGLSAREFSPRLVETLERF